MGLIKIIIFLVALGYGAQYVRDHYMDSDSDTKSPNGFMPVPSVDGLTGAAVIIVTAPGSPDEVVARGNKLAFALLEKGIPVLRAERVNFASGGNSVAAATAMLTLSGEPPLVLVRGRAKPNPTLDEVVREFLSH